MLKRPTILNTIGKRPEIVPCKRENTNGQKKSYEKICNLISNQGNVNLNHYDIPFLSILEKLKSAITGAAEFGSS